MQIIRDLNTYIDERTVIAIGKFDGFHLGHKALFDAAKTMKRPGERLLVFTFSMPPRVLTKGRNVSSILTPEEKIEAAERMGADIYLECLFTEEVKRIEPMDFLKNVLLEKLNMRALVAGTDCTFGHMGAGDAAFLKDHAEELGYDLRIVDKVTYKGEEISSTRIKKCITEGMVADADRMLGFNYGFSGAVRHGHRLGHKLGFPTVNIPIDECKTVPKFGVYAVRAHVGERSFTGMSNIGSKPTVSAREQIGLETNLFDFDEEIYGAEIKVEMLDFVRPERKFDSLDELGKQLANDKLTVLDMTRGS